MDPAVRKSIITFGVVALAAGVFAAVVFGKGPKRPPVPVEQPVAAAATGSAAGSAAGTAPAPVGNESAEAVAGAASMNAPLVVLRASPADPAQLATADSIAGTVDPLHGRFAIHFAAHAAGITRIEFSDFWQTAQARQEAITHATAATIGASNIPPLPAEGERFNLRAYGVLGNPGIDVPMLAMHSVEVDGVLISLFGAVWSSERPGSFATLIGAEGDSPILRIERNFEITKMGAGYDIAQVLSAANLDDRQHEVRFISYGPGDLTLEAGAFIDARRLQTGYLLSEDRDAGGNTVLWHDGTMERADVIKKVSASEFTIWPTEIGLRDKLRLAWIGSASRYFALAIHAPYSPPQRDSKVLGSAVETIKATMGKDASGVDVVFSELHSASVPVAAGTTYSFLSEVYAGPLDRNVLGAAEPLSSLGMTGLIRYSLGGMCACCTFAWLADGLAAFLDFLHDYVVFDWALAIIVLVIVVRTLLHPLTKKSQVQMARFGKGMSELKPELEALQKRYSTDAKKLQAETMRLYKEKGVNPLGCAGGMLPTFLQMPIWMALYAVLYLAFELRQQPAFFGIFQQINGWSFLSDLSAADSFIRLPNSINLWMFSLHSINLIPLLMGVVFWVQQKYMAPPQAANQTPEQEQQQKLMRVMMVVMFPLMLYAAPSGLTLYILTSTCIGIMESKLIREGMAREDKLPKPPPGSKPKGAVGRAFAAALERAQQKSQDKLNKPSKFKNR